MMTTEVSQQASLTEISLERKIDITVATRFMGWHRAGDNDKQPVYRDYWYDTNGESTGELHSDTDDYYQPQAAWSPSTDIAAAWQVWEKAGDMLVAKTMDDSGFKYVAYQATGYADPDFGDYCAYADTAPMAICLAALEKIGVEV